MLFERSRPGSARPLATSEVSDGNERLPHFRGTVMQCLGDGGGGTPEWLDRSERPPFEVRAERLGLGLDGASAEAGDRLPALPAGEPNRNGAVRKSAILGLRART